MSRRSPKPSLKSKKRNRGTLSCAECHRRKQKCDRAQPCQDCLARSVPDRCQYVTPPYQVTTLSPMDAAKMAISRARRIMTGEEVLLSTESVAALAAGATLDPLSSPTPLNINMHNASFNCKPPFMTRSIGYSIATSPFHLEPTVSSGLSYTNSLSNYDPFSILPDIEGEPVPKHMLIRYYIERLAPWLCYLDNHLDAQAPKIAWLAYAVEHPAFYYGTLLTSAVHLNRRRKFKDPGVLIWYKARTLQLANETMRSGDVNERAGDEMIMTALILLYFNVGGANIEEYEIHLRGIHQMLILRGGREKLGMRGMVNNWLAISFGPWHDGFEYGGFG